MPEVKVKTPQLDVEQAKLAVKYFEQMLKANQEIAKLIEFNLADAKKNLNHAEIVEKADPNQTEIPLDVQPKLTKSHGKVQKTA